MPGRLRSAAAHARSIPGAGSPADLDLPDATPSNVLSPETGSPQWSERFAKADISISTNISTSTLHPAPPAPFHDVGEWVIIRALLAARRRKALSPLAIGAGRGHPRSCGGIGRRAGFRIQWAQARGGSSPLGSTVRDAVRHPLHCPGAETGRQARLRIWCLNRRGGSSPLLGTV
jgi:hypothetical protein